MGNAQAVAASGALDPRHVETLENRAKAMEERIAELEKATTTPGPVAAVPPAAGSASAQSTAAHEMEVQRLRDALAAAEGGPPGDGGQGARPRGGQLETCLSGHALEAKLQVGGIDIWWL